MEEREAKPEPSAGAPKLDLPPFRLPNNTLRTLDPEHNIALPTTSHQLQALRSEATRTQLQQATKALIDILLPENKELEEHATEFGAQYDPRATAWKVHIVSSCANAAPELQPYVIERVALIKDDMVRAQSIEALSSSYSRFEKVNLKPIIDAALVLADHAFNANSDPHLSISTFRALRRSEGFRTDEQEVMIKEAQKTWEFARNMVPLRTDNEPLHKLPKNTAPDLDILEINAHSVTRLGQRVYDQSRYQMYQMQKAALQIAARAESLDHAAHRQETAGSVRQNDDGGESNRRAMNRSQASRDIS